MLITEKLFNSYKSNLSADDCLLYGERNDGDFTSVMFGDSFNLMIAMCCIIEAFAKKSNMNPVDVTDDLKGMIEQAQRERMKKEGGDR